MPWKESSVMEERLRFVARLLEGERMSDVCLEFGISRKTGYKIINRYKEEEPFALCDRSRRPVRYAIIANARDGSPLGRQHLFHLGGEFLEVEGLGQEREGNVRIEVLAEGFFGVSRDENDLHVGPQRMGAFDQRRPVHVGHDHISNGNVDLLIAVLEKIESHFRRLRLHHGISFVLQRACRKQTNRWIVSRGVV